MSTEYFGCRGHKTNDTLALLNLLTKQQKRQIHGNRAVGLMLSQELYRVKVWRGKRMRGRIPRSDSEGMGARGQVACGGERRLGANSIRSHCRLPAWVSEPE